MDDFLMSIFGTYTAGQWIAYMYFALMGALIYSWREVKDRDVQGTKTPVKFSFRFLIRDNIKRYILTLLLIYIQFRFFKEMTGYELTEYTALLIGFSSDGLSGISKNTTKYLQADREKLMTKL